jgi:pimeloyl-ACP methyl ester carboxylesterase
MRRILRQGILGLFALIALAYAAMVAYAYWPGPEEVPVIALAGPDDRFVTLDGVRLRYRTWGTPGAGRPNVLLVHGFANSLQSWRELGPRLAGEAYVVAVDLPGFGLSDKPVDFDYRNEPQARRMVAVARALALDRPVYAGHSLGGAIAMRAALADDDAGGLVLINPGILTTGVPKIVQYPIPPLPRLSAKQFGSRAFRERFLKLSYVRPEIVTPEVVDEVMLAARSEGYMAGTTALMKQYEEGGEIPLLDRIGVPTLIVWGNEDRNKLPSEADDLVSRIPRAELVRVPGAGHYVHEEAPDAVAEAMRQALARWRDVRPVGLTTAAVRRST